MVRPKEEIEKKMFIYFFILILIVLVLFIRIWYLQVMASDKFIALAEENRIREISLKSLRGKIYDRNQTLLVSNKPSYAAVYSGEEIAGDDIIKRLAKLLDIPEEELKKKMKESEKNPLQKIVIKENVNIEEISYLREHKTSFPGLDVEISASRDYPLGDLAAHLVGNMGEITEEELKEDQFSDCSLGDVIGKTGIERVFDKQLRGIKGVKEVEVDALGDPIRTINEEEPLPGYDLILTIDKDIQKKTEEALAESIRLAKKDGYGNADAGAIVVIDPQDGEVLSMASFPTYSPSMFIDGLSQDEWETINSKESNFPLFNRVVAASYPPGSIFKPFTLIAGLEEEIINSGTTFICKGRWEGMGKSWPKYCWKRTGHGEVGVSRGIAESCDTFFYEVGYKFYKTKEEQLQEWARKFGFGEKTGISLASETEGRVPDEGWKKSYYKDPQQKVWLPGDSVNLSIGQGDMLTTPMQIAMAYSAILNGGRLIQPKVMKALINPREKRTYLNIDNENNGREKIIDVSSYSLGLLKRALKRVVSEGTAKDAFAGFPVSVGGKTGTAEVAGKDDFAWFVCFAPYDNPEYLIVILVEQGGHGGSVAAVTARKLLSYIFEVPYSLPKTIQDISR